jgi:hypothetical protein
MDPQPLAPVHVDMFNRSLIADFIDSVARNSTVSAWTLCRVRHLKRRNSDISEHEGLVFDIKEVGGLHKGFLLTDRHGYDGAGEAVCPQISRAVEKVYVPTFLLPGPRNAVDLARIHTDWDVMADEFSKGSGEPLVLADMNLGVSPTIHQLSHVIKAVHDQRPSYDIYHSQCFWFAHAVWHCVEKEFAGEVKERSEEDIGLASFDNRGFIRIFQLTKGISVQQVDIILNQYRRLLHSSSEKKALAAKIQVLEQRLSEAEARILHQEDQLQEQARCIRRLQRTVEES